MNVEFLKWLLIIIVLLGVSCDKPTPKSNQKLPGDGLPSSETIAINEVIATSIAEFGGRPRTHLPATEESIRLLYPIQRDANGVQYWLSGDHARSLITMFSAVYGAPKLIQTNVAGYVNAAYQPPPICAKKTVTQRAKTC